MTIRISPFRTLPTRHAHPLSLILPHNPLHRPQIMLRLAHIVQFRSPRPLLFPLHNFYPFYIRTIYFKPHLHGEAREVVSEQDCRVDGAVSLANVEADAGEVVAVFEAYQEDVSWLDALGVG